MGNAVQFELFGFLWVFRLENGRDVGRLARAGEGPGIQSQRPLGLLRLDTRA